MPKGVNNVISKFLPLYIVVKEPCEKQKGKKKRLFYTIARKNNIVMQSVFYI